VLEDENNVLYTTLKEYPTKDGITNEMVLQEVYDIAFGVNDHSNDSSPLSLIKMHPTEDVHSRSMLYSRVKRYINMDIHQSTGLNLTNFLELPREMVELIFAEITAKNTKTGSAMHDLAKKAGLT
jgi:hypothetical protein